MKTYKIHTVSYHIELYSILIKTISPLRCCINASKNLNPAFSKCNYMWYKYTLCCLWNYSVIPLKMLFYSALAWQGNPESKNSSCFRSGCFSRIANWIQSNSHWSNEKGQTTRTAAAWSLLSWLWREHKDWPSASLWDSLMVHSFCDSDLSPESLQASRPH